TDCAPARLQCFLPRRISSRSRKSATSLTQRLIRNAVMWAFFLPLARRLTHCSAQWSIAPGLAGYALHAFNKLRASFRYWSRFGRAGRGNAPCGLGNIRNDGFTTEGTKRHEEARSGRVVFLNDMFPEWLYSQGHLMLCAQCSTGNVIA